MGILSSKHQQHHAASTLLLAPAMEGNLSEIKRLVGIYIADHSKTTLASYINSTDAASGGNAAIHGAVFGGHLDILKFLIESCQSCNGGSNDGGDDDNSSAVAVAVVDLTIKNGLGCSPLWIAAGYDRIECLQYLIHQLQLCSSISSIDQLNDAILEPNSTGDTPFMAAVSKGHIGVCKVLLKAAHYEKKNESSSSNSDNYDETLVASSIMDMKCKLLRTANNSGDTPLKVAVATGQCEELISLLLHEDELVDEWMTTKHAATTTTTTTANSDAIQSKCINRKNEAGLSPLIVACERNLPSIVELLLKHDADISIQDSKGRNPLAVAAFCGCDDVVDFLLNKANNNNDDGDAATAITTCLLNGTDDNGCTPLWLAARTGNLSMVKVLMDAGADCTIVNNDDMTPYNVAVKFKKDKVVEWFEEREEEK